MSLSPLGSPVCSYKSHVRVGNNESTVEFVWQIGTAYSTVLTTATPQVIQSTKMKVEHTSKRGWLLGTFVRVMFLGTILPLFYLDTFE